MRLPSKSIRNEASWYLPPRRSHGVLTEAEDFHGSLWRLSPWRFSRKTTGGQLLLQVSREMAYSISELSGIGLCLEGGLDQVYARP